MSYQVRPQDYGDALSEIYDHMYLTEETPATVEFLASLARPGARIVELGAGTGRLAVPLAAKGFTVYAVEISEPMLDKLRDHDSFSTVRTVCADFTKYVVDSNFDLCYIVCNTLFMVPDPEQQIAALRKAADHLVPGGTLAVEVYDPTYFHNLSKSESQVRHLAADKIMIDTITTDSVNQVVFEVHTLIENGSMSTYTELSRYAWPAELDLMVRSAGMSKLSSYGDWDRSTFRPGGRRHIMLYRKPE